MKYDNKRLDLQDNGEVKNAPATLEEYVAYYDSARKEADKYDDDVFVAFDEGHNTYYTKGLCVAKKTMYDNLAEVMVKQMLSDPTHDSLRYAIVMKPEKEEALYNVAKDYLKKQKILGDPKEKALPENALKKIGDALKNSSYKSGIVKAFAEKEKRLAKTNAAKNDIKVENEKKKKKADEGIKAGKK